MSPHDPIGDYLRQLRVSLRGPAPEADLIVAEAEDHLRETAAAAMAIGMTEREAQEAAISAFGAVRAVVRAHQSRRAEVAAAAGEVGLASWKLISVLLLAGGATGLVTVAAATLRGHLFRGGQIFAVNPDVRWLAWSVIAGAGAVLLAGYGLVRRKRPGTGRRRRPLADANGPAAGFFAAAAVTLVVLNVFRLGAPFDPGLVILTCLALAVGYAVRMGHALRHRG